MRKACLMFSFLIILIGCETSKESKTVMNDIPKLSGAYLGQSTPGDSAELFAPGFISTGMYNRDMAMTPDGNEIFFCVSTMGLNLIFFTKQVEGVWTEPQVAPFITDFEYMYYEPHIVPDGSKLLFLSNRPRVEGQKPNEDIWAVKREGDTWGEPYNLGEPICTEDAEYFPSVTRDGTLYFSRQKRGERTTFIYRSRIKDGVYQEPEKLGPEVNCGTSRYNAFVDPEEKFLIIPSLGMKDTRGGTDYYIVFRDKDDTWHKPINMGDRINTKSGREYSPYISPDGKYFFFMSSKSSLGNASSLEEISYSELLDKQCQSQNGNSDIYWIDASFINELIAN